MRKERKKKKSIRSIIYSRDEGCSSKKLRLKINYACTIKRGEKPLTRYEN